MDVKERYTKEDCVETGPACSIAGKVVALSDSGDPLFYCTGGNGAAASQTGRAAFGVSLKNGEFHRFDRSDVIGVLKPELLPDSAKLQLSQIRPTGALSLELNDPAFSGYSFLPDGRYAAGVWLCTPQEVMEYVEMQKPYQHRVLICDREDFAVMEVVEGQLIYPTPEALETFRQGEQKQSGGMEMT